MMLKQHLLSVASIAIEDFEKAKKGNDYMGDVFVIFKVVTNIHDFDNAIRYGIQKSEVWHRYSEFDLLYQYLLHTYPSDIIPPLPEKKLTTNIWTKMTTDKFDGEYLEHRKIGLEKFLMNIATHPTLHDDNIFKAFLMKGEGWREVADSTEFRSKNEGFIKGIAASYQLKNCDPRFAELRTYADELENRINAVLKVTHAICGKQRHIYGIYKEFSNTYCEWSTIEKALNIPLQKTGQYLDNLEGAGNVLLLDEELKFFESMKEYANYASSLKDLVRKYELLQYKIEVLEATIETKKAQIALLGKPEAGEDVVSTESSSKTNISNFFKMTPQQKEVRRAKLKSELSDAEDALGPTLEEMETFKSEADKEIGRWKKEKFRNLTQTLKMYAKLQLAHCNEGLQCWSMVGKTVKPLLQGQPKV